MSTVDLASTQPASAARTSARHRMGPRGVSDADRILQVMRHVRVELGLNRTIAAAGEEMLRIFSAARVLVAGCERDGERALLWTIDAASRSSVEAPATLSAAERRTFFSDSPRSWIATRRAATRAPRFRIECDLPASDTSAARIEPALLALLRPRAACVAVSCDFGADWRARLVIVDPAVAWRPAATFGLARRMAADLVPAVYNVYLVHRLQVQAAAVERDELARVLHDSTVQSLIAAEMQVHAACRRAAEQRSDAAAELLCVERLLHEEVLGIRDLMQRLERIHVEPHELCNVLADRVERFKAHTGFSVSFLADVSECTLTAAQCGHVVRIVQEALSNVRKHSGGRRAFVFVAGHEGAWRIAIDDDGRGGEPDRVLAPFVIRECVRALDGTLQVRRSDAGGWRLEIEFNVARTAPPAPLSWPSSTTTPTSRQW